MRDICQTCGRYLKISSYLDGKACECPKPPADSKPREWWLVDRPDGNGVHAFVYKTAADQYLYENDIESADHVIEHSAYAQLERERDAWKTMNDFRDKQERCNDWQGEYHKAIIERDKYRAALEKIGTGNAPLEAMKSWRVESLIQVIEHDETCAREALKSQDLPPFTVAGNPSDSSCATTREE